MKELIKRLFRIKTYEEDNKRLAKRWAETQQAFEIAREQCESLKKYADALSEENEELRKLNDDPTQYICDLTEEVEVLRTDIQVQINRARSEGYREAYAKMGLFVLEARQEGRLLYYDNETLDVVEVIPDTSLVDICAEEEIDISDLEDIYDGQKTVGTTEAVAQRDQVN